MKLIRRTFVQAAAAAPAVAVPLLRPGRAASGGSAVPGRASGSEGVAQAVRYKAG